MTTHKLLIKNLSQSYKSQNITKRSKHRNHYLRYGVTFKNKNTQFSYVTFDKYSHKVPQIIINGTCSKLCQNLSSQEIHNSVGVTILNYSKSSIQLVNSLRLLLKDCPV